MDTSKPDPACEKCGQKLYRVVLMGDEVWVCPTHQRNWHRDLPALGVKVSEVVKAQERN